MPKTNYDIIKHANGTYVNLSETRVDVFVIAMARACVFVVAVQNTCVYAHICGVPTFPRQMVFVIGTSTPRYKHIKKPFVPITNYDVIKHVDVTNVISRVGDACRYVR